MGPEDDLRRVGVRSGFSQTPSTQASSAPVRQNRKPDQPWFDRRAGAIVLTFCACGGKRRNNSRSSWLYATGVADITTKTMFR